jgi:Bacterial aa3 type cytochrome c oxidase subunit IV
MASEPQVSGTAPMDYKEHNATYELFIRMSAVLTPVFITWVIGLAVGAFKGSWFFAAVIILVSSAAALIGLFSKELSWKPAMGTLVFGLACLLLV